MLNCSDDAGAGVRVGSAVVIPNSTAAANAAAAGSWGAAFAFGTNGDEEIPCLSNTAADKDCVGLIANAVAVAIAVAVAVAGAGAREGSPATKEAPPGFDKARVDCGVLGGVLSAVQNSSSAASAGDASTDGAGGLGPNGMRRCSASFALGLKELNNRAAALSVNGLAAVATAAVATAAVVPAVVGNAIVVGALGAATGMVDGARSDPVDDRKAASAWLFAGAGAVTRAFAACASAAMLLYSALACSVFFSAAAAATTVLLLAGCTVAVDDMLSKTMAEGDGGCGDELR